MHNKVPCMQTVYTLTVYSKLLKLVLVKKLNYLELYRKFAHQEVLFVPLL